MMTFFELEHMVDATQLCLSCHCTHGGCYATVRWGGVGMMTFFELEHMNFLDPGTLNNQDSMEGPDLLGTKNPVTSNFE